MAENRRLAVLIDADNAPASIADGLFDEIARLGEASIRRIYGDFASGRVKGWRDVLTRHAIVPQQQFAYTTGKNASDITLVIDAMDVLHGGRVDGFCLVSSDSDFTRLASRIREEGLVVYGFGEQKTPEAFRQACTRFIYIENLIGTEAPGPATQPAAPPARSPARGRGGRGRAKAGTPEAPAAPAPAAPAAAAPRAVIQPSSALMPAIPQPELEAEATAAPLPAPLRQPPAAAVPLILKALAHMEDEDGWYPLGSLGNVLLKLHPDFDPRSYGHAKLSTLVAKTGAFRERKGGGRGMEIQPIG
jgi:hypothetical protein